LIWRLEDRHPKPTKVPYQAKRPGVKASVTDPATWNDFKTAVAVVARGHADGIGYVVTANDSYTGIDLDDAIDSTTRQLRSWVAAAVTLLDSYTERSPSGRGLRVFVRATKTGPRCKAYQRHGWGHAEIYDHQRFFTVTGNHLAGTPTAVEPRQRQLELFYKALFPAKPVKPASELRSVIPLDLDDQEILDLARGARNGERFRRLWDADISGYGSASEADAALVSMLAFWCGNDPDRIERLFERSGLGQRAKWTDRPDYRHRTIGFALEYLREVYTPPARGEDGTPIRSRPGPTRISYGDGSRYGLGALRNEVRRIREAPSDQVEAALRTAQRSLDRLVQDGHLLGPVVQRELERAARRVVEVPA